MLFSSSPLVREAHETQALTYEHKLLTLASAGFLYLVSVHPLNVSLNDHERSLLNPFAADHNIEIYSSMPPQMPLDGELRNRALKAYNTLKTYLSGRHPQFVFHRNVSSSADETQLPYSLGKSKYKILFNPDTNAKEIWMQIDMTLATDEAIQNFRAKFPDVVFAHLEGKSKANQAKN